MRQRRSHVGALHLVERRSPEGPTRGGQDDRGDGRRVLSDEALKDRTVLAVDRQQPRTARTGKLDEQVSCGDDELFVGDGNVRAALDGGKHRLEGYRAVGRGQQYVGLGLDGDTPQSRRAVARARRDRHAEARGLLVQQLDVAAGRESDDLELAGMSRDHVERLRADRPRRP